MKKLSFFIFSFLLLLYPFGVFYGLRYFEPKYLGVLLCAILLCRVLVFTKSGTFSATRLFGISTGIGIIFCFLVYFSNQAQLLKLYPLLVNLLFLVLFGLTLRYPPSAIERCARLTRPNLPPAAVVYTYRVTIAWCIFFVINGFLSAYTALFSSMEIWTLYNGCVSYLLMGLLFLVEFLVRMQKLKGI